ncbi:Two-component system YycF/YycG regulatory protein YycH [Paraliobacillus sp. PM-2]|uniref:YycH family regulatory protein n=1 Tax=Paraliobacillus sp. PM-2 TaxID=1462524 RepID=UPI00061BB549|nr:two-component system activity regulator YycH [Paraliobacillus sp. PM-2]CQR45839.1 Two-component system YycF/YycG regulatory protein YycH [Paraliobacillus sp. PM-2]
MKFKSWTTIILTFLVGLSLLLTAAIWNYQPSYDQLTNEEDVIEAQLNGETQSKKQTIQPSQIIYHVEGQPLRLEYKEDEKELYNKMQTWSIFDFSATTMEYHSIDKIQNLVEVIFPTELPNEILKDLFVVDDEIIPNGSFDRMYIKLSNKQEDTQLLFAKADTGMAIRASIQNYGQIVTYLNNYRDNNTTSNYVIFENSNNENVYLPETVNLSSYLSSYKEIEVDPFINLLFKTPSSVKSSFLKGGAMIYTDGTRELTRDANRISFTDPSNATKIDDKSISVYQLLDQVHNNFMNTHLGFTATEPFRFVLSDLSTTANTNMVNYTLSFKGYPVYQIDSLTKISVQWHDQKIHKYTHPTIQLLDIRGPGQQSSVLNASNVISILQGENYKNRMIYDVAIGYKLEQQTGKQLYKLTPTWYVQGISGWEQLEVPEQWMGGENNAVGSN